MENLTNIRWSDGRPERKQGGTGLPADQDQLLILRIPQDADVVVVWDAFLVFVEDLFDLDICDEYHAAWSEVASDAFDATVSEYLEKTETDTRLFGIWGGDRVAIIAPKGCVCATEWSDLRQTLEASTPCSDGAVRPWQVVRAPFEASANQAPAPLPREQQPRNGPDVERKSAWPVIPMANRHRPVLATPEQRAYLSHMAAQANGRAPTIAMEPIILDNPDREALRAAIEVLQERHESLHSTFVLQDGRPFIVLDDSRPIPLDHKRIMRPFHSLETQAQQRTREIAKTLHLSTGHWQACLIEARDKGAVICVFSQTIADQSAVDTFRTELVAFYEAFRSGRDPEAETGRPPLQYTDYAAFKRESGPAVAWWEELLAPGFRPSTEPSLPRVAPVNRWRQTLPADLANDLLSSDIFVSEASLLSAFLRTLHHVEGMPPAWITLPVRDQRPSEAQGCLGQFTRLCPVWLEDLAEGFNHADVFRRLDGLRAFGPMCHAELARALPGRIPARIRYRLDFLPHGGWESELDEAEDICLSVRQRDGKLTADWAIRRDHPLCQRPEYIHSVFCDQFSATKAVCV